MPDQGLREFWKRQASEPGFAIRLASGLIERVPRRAWVNVGSIGHVDSLEYRLMGQSFLARSIRFAFLL